MKEKNIDIWLKDFGLNKTENINYNINPILLIEEAIKNNEGILASNGALVCETGKFTGRAPNDRFIVKDNLTKDDIHWGETNIAFDENDFDKLLNKIINHISSKKLYIRDAYACTDPQYRIKIRIINTLAWHNLFSNYMFIRNSKEVKNEIDFTIINAPEFEADPNEDKTRSKNFVIINFSKKIILIGGTKYAGEIKKSIFSSLNYLLPKNHNVLPMHCAANIGEKQDTALFFGLSGTGKTTLSTDTGRRLIGDDEHGWSDKGIFNFEGGCYAKTINLSPKNEIQIYNAIKFGTILENVCFYKNTRDVNYSDDSLTENTRTSYPIDNIPNHITESYSPEPKNIFFLACDAYGVLPPVSKLNANQAMYHFLSGYTAKVAGTESGIIEPEATFQACFGLPFLPLNPIKYVNMLGEKLQNNKINVWLINTGWTGGPYGIGNRIRINETRKIIRTAINGDFDKIEFHSDNIFKLNIPKSCPEVDSQILDPINMWDDKNDYKEKAQHLIELFDKNFEKYNVSDKNIIAGKF